MVAGNKQQQQRTTPTASKQATTAFQDYNA